MPSHFTFLLMFKIPYEGCLKWFPGRTEEVGTCGLDLESVTHITYIAYVSHWVPPNLSLYSSEK